MYASFEGKLTSNEYQFSFGQNAPHTGGIGGFLLPHSGRVKKVKIRMFPWHTLSPFDDLGNILFKITLDNVVVANYIHNSNDNLREGFYKVTDKNFMFDRPLEDVRFSEGI